MDSAEADKVAIISMIAKSKLLENYASFAALSFLIYDTGTARHL